MPVTGEATSGGSMAGEQGRQRRPRGHPVLETPDPSPMARPSKPTISSLLLHPGEPAPAAAAAKKTHFSPASKFRGLGCAAAASQQVSVPAVIRESADWDRRKAKRKQKKGFLSKGRDSRAARQGLLAAAADGPNFGCSSSASCVVAEDAWCGPGIGFSAADADCVVAVGRRNAAMVAPPPPPPAASRGPHRERPCLPRRAMNPDHLCLFGSDHGVESLRLHHQHARAPYAEDLAEMMMLHGGLIMGGRLDRPDRYRGWRLDVDNMSYEQLLELGDRIGYVSTGLKDDEIGRCIRKIKLASLGDLSHHLPVKNDGKCSICQEEYEVADELGKLECGHGFHLECIKQWLSQKNICPICKSEPVART